MTGPRGLGGVVLAAAVAAACATAAPPSNSSGSAPPGDALPGDVVLTLAPGKTVPVGGAPLQVRFDGVENDSRCPADVACIQAGEAVVGITVIAADGRRQRYQLHTTGATSAVHDGLTISLEMLDPRPAGSRPIRPADYRLTLRVRR